VAAIVGDNLSTFPVNLLIHEDKRRRLQQVNQNNYVSFNFTIQSGHLFNFDAYLLD
jgi:hypothetical protein